MVFCSSLSTFPCYCNGEFSRKATVFIRVPLLIPLHRQPLFRSSQRKWKHEVQAWSNSLSPVNKPVSITSLPSCGGQGLFLFLLWATSWPLSSPTGTWSVSHSHSFQALNCFPKVSFSPQACKYAFAHLLCVFFSFVGWGCFCSQLSRDQPTLLVGTPQGPRGGHRVSVGRERAMDEFVLMGCVATRMYICRLPHSMEVIGMEGEKKGLL